MTKFRCLIKTCDRSYEWRRHKSKENANNLTTRTARNPVALKRRARKYSFKPLKPILALPPGSPIPRKYQSIFSQDTHCPTTAPPPPAPPPFGVPLWHPQFRDLLLVSSVVLLSPFSRSFIVVVVRRRLRRRRRR